MNYEGHLNLPKKIHQKEGFGDSTIVIHWGTWYAQTATLKKPKIEKAKGELQGLVDYQKLLEADFKDRVITNKTLSEIFQDDEQEKNTK
jgi:hypothetical protein